MGFTKHTLKASDGFDQLKNDVGQVQAGDVVTVNLKGRFLKGTKEVEYEDTYHSEKRITFTVGQKGGTTSQHGKPIIRGMEEGVQSMVLGEESRLKITSDYGYGDSPHKGYVKTVPPNSDLVLDVAVMKIVPDGVAHNRKQPSDDADGLTTCCYLCCRAY